MSAESIVVAALKANSTIQSLLGNGDSPATYRIDPMINVQGDSLPRITYQRVGTPPTGSLDGDGTIENARIQIDCWAEGYDEVKALAAAVKVAMATTESYKLDESDPDLDETATHRVSFDYSVWVRLGG